MTRGLRRGRTILTAAATALALICALSGSPAIAGPSVWSRAREPGLAAEDELVREAQKLVMRYRKRLRSKAPHDVASAALAMRDAREKLAKAIASGATDFGARLLYVQVLRDSNANDEAEKTLTKLLADRPPAPLRAEALGELAILHALAGRREEEIRAYTDALAIEPHAYQRCRLLANRAEAFMAMGDVTAAVEGYRAALAPLTTIELFYYAPTALFGMGVALDRTGDLQEGLASIQLARAYDPIDRGLTSPTWFFSPSWDSHWYWALGAWSTARGAETWAARAESYARSILEWELYLEAAPETDRWKPLARVRLQQVKREEAEMRKRFEASRKPALPGVTPLVRKPG